MKDTLIRPLFLVSYVGVLVGLAAPVSAADKETRQMMADIRMLQEQSQELSILLASITEKLTDAVKGLNSRLDQQAEATRKSFADQKLTIDAVAGDLRIVRERMDDNNVRIGSLTQEVDALRQSVLGLNLGQPSTGGGVADPSPGATAPAAAAVPSIIGGLSPQRTFDMAHADFMIGQYELSISGFEGYLRSFPKSEQAADAQLLIGNAYLQMGRNDRALEAYDLAIRTYPGKPALAEATYKKGVAHANLRQLDDARAAFEMVLKSYPESLEALLAKQKLESLAPAAQKKP